MPASAPAVSISNTPDSIAHVGGVVRCDYGCRRVQMLARDLRPLVDHDGFLDVDHVCDHLATLAIDHSHHSGLHAPADALLQSHLRDLLDRVRGAHATIFSASTGLLAHRQIARFVVHPANPNPLCIDHNVRVGWGRHLPRVGWLIWPAETPLPTTSSAVIALAAAAARAVDRERPT